MLHMNESWECVAVCCSVWPCHIWMSHKSALYSLISSENALQCVAVCCSMLQCVTMSHMNESWECRECSRGRSPQELLRRILMSFWRISEELLKMMLPRSSSEGSPSEEILRRNLSHSGSICCEPWWARRYNFCAKNVALIHLFCLLFLWIHWDKRGAESALGVALIHLFWLNGFNGKGDKSAHTPLLSQWIQWKRRQKRSYTSFVSMDPMEKETKALIHLFCLNGSNGKGDNSAHTPLLSQLRSCTSFVSFSFESVLQCVAVRSYTSFVSFSFESPRPLSRHMSPPSYKKGRNNAGNINGKGYKFSKVSSLLYLLNKTTTKLIFENI